MGWLKQFSSALNFFSEYPQMFSSALERFLQKPWSRSTWKCLRVTTYGAYAYWIQISHCYSCCSGNLDANLSCGHGFESQNLNFDFAKSIKNFTGPKKSGTPGNCREHAAVITRVCFRTQVMRLNFHEFYPVKNSPRIGYEFSQVIFGVWLRIWKLLFSSLSGMAWVKTLKWVKLQIEMRKNRRDWDEGRREGR